MLADTDHYLRNELFQLQAHIDLATDEPKRPSGDGNTIILALDTVYKVILPGGAEAIIRQTVKVSTNLFTELDSLGNTYILVRRAPLTWRRLHQRGHRRHLDGHAVGDGSRPQRGVRHRSLSLHPAPPLFLEAPASTS